MLGSERDPQTLAQGQLAFVKIDPRQPIRILVDCIVLVECDALVDCSLKSWPVAQVSLRRSGKHL